MNHNSSIRMRSLCAADLCAFLLFGVPIDDSWEVRKGGHKEMEVKAEAKSEIGRVRKQRKEWRDDMVAIDRGRGSGRGQVKNK